MSEERRRRKQEREGTAPAANPRKYVKWAIIVALFVGAYLGGFYYKNHKYDNFAKCLATHDAKMYGLYWCPHCIEQKEKFGASFQYVPYVECAVKGSNEAAAPCKIAGVKMYPSWQFGNEPPKEGVESLDALSDKTGCALP
ncbi:MAG TPA: hypothetical protein VKV39_04025 [Candidatus Sulfotelmatobacter sp.]|nr:hypothetical protein [Candidatus Sulfotelmatobacter sp.]